MASKRANTICKLNNAGSTLVTVIVAISFVTILAGMLLSTTLMNVRMKAIDRHAKDDFYFAEKALDDVYTGIGQEVSIIAGNAYDKYFSLAGSTEDYSIAQKAENEFKAKYITDVKNLYDISLDDLKTKLQGFITNKGTVDSIAAVQMEKKDGTVTSVVTDAYDLRLKDVQITATDVYGYQSVITTDIVVYIPSVDFLGANVDVTDYGLIANKGLYINGSSTVTGNIYAGIHPTPIPSKDDDAINLYGGINIDGGVSGSDVKFKGNYIVSKGDINLSGVNPKLTIGTSGVTNANLPYVWFDSLRTVKDASAPNVSICANTFALNDLELNADNSDVTIEGNYYGYNDKSINTSNLLGYTANREDAESSAIIINGSSCALDMKKIDTFVLMGKAYIDFNKRDTNGGIEATNVDADKQVVPTAEGVALKTNQQLYLVPIEFLNCPNPIGGDEFSTTYSSKFSISTTKPDIRQWFGYKYVIPGGVDDVDSTAGDVDESGTLSVEQYKKFYEPYKVTIGSGTETEDVWYAFLKFNDKRWIYDDTNKKYVETSDPIGTNGAVSSMSAFFGDIMRATTETASEIQPSALRLKQRLNNSMKYSYFDLQKCIVGDKDNLDKTLLYARNAVVSYDVTAGQSNLIGNTAGMGRFGNYPTYLFHRYQWLCTKLDGKEGVEMERDPGVITADTWEVASSNDAPPLSHYVLLDKITSTLDTTDDRDTADAEGLKNVIYGDCIIKSGDFEIGSDASTVTVGTTFKGIAIVDGNITVKSGYNVYGLLMATGTITIEGGGSVITYDKGLIQSRIEKEMQLVKEYSGNAADAYKEYYLISYLSKSDRTPGSTGSKLYDVTPGSAIKEERREADYNDFVQFENWKKGER